MQQQLTRLRGAWLGIPGRARYAVIGVAAVTLVVMLLVIRASMHTEWAPVATDLASEKVGEAQTALDDAGIQNRVSTTGSAVEVAKADVPKAAAVLIPAGIAAKGNRAGCAAQSEKGGSMMAQTSAEHDLMIETCSENDAANTIEMLDGIDSARVDITPASSALFGEDEKPAKASVLVDTGGASLSSKTVKGIQATVAAATEGLQPRNVTVTDETGAIIGGDGSEEDTAASMVKLDTEAKFNSKVENDLTKKFEQIVGEGNVNVTSNVELDMDRIDRGVHHTEAAGENGEQLIKDENYKKEILNGTADAGVQGVAGTATNQGVDPDNRTVTPDTTASASGDGGYASDENAVNYDNNVIEEKIGVAPGSVVRNRISVVIDDDVDASAAQAVKDSAQAWMGGNAQDSFSFNLAPLATATAGTSSSSAASSGAGIANWVKYVLLGMGLIGLAFVLRRSLTQRTAELLAPADDLLLLDSGEMSPIPIAELEAALAANQPSADRRERLEMQRKVEQIAMTKPHDVANELRRWMHQEDRDYAPRKAG
ncbi:MAG: hypothetical protein KDC46_00470 [Thermoleophilia bacterium]|nr:hypothetical protein [Thermoleophilia bacterium]